MATVADLVEETRNLLYGSTRQEMNRLSVAVTDTTSTTITLEFDLNALTRNSYISVNDEIMYVFSTNPSAKTALVQRGFLGSTKSTHAIGDIVEVNARFPRPKIKDALKQAIDSLAPRLFYVDSASLAGSSTSALLPLPDDTFLNIIDVRRAAYSTGGTRPIVTAWDLERTIPGAQLIFPRLFEKSVSVYVRFARAFDVSTFNNTTDVNTTIKMATSMNDIPPLDAAFRLMGTKEVIRTALTAQPEPRSAEEVPPGHIGSVVSQIRKLRDDRISEEMMRLRNTYAIKGW